MNIQEVRSRIKHAKCQAAAIGVGTWVLLIAPVGYARFETRMDFLPGLLFTAIPAFFIGYIASWAHGWYMQRELRKLQDEMEGTS